MGSAVVEIKQCWQKKLIISALFFHILGEIYNFFGQAMDILSNSSAPSSSPQQLMKFCLLWTVLQRTKPPDVCNSVLSQQHQQHKFHDLDKVLDHNEFIKKFQHGNSADASITSPKKQDHILLGSANNLQNNHAFQYHFKHSSRSLSVIGVLGGIVLILFFVALSTCIKHRRNLYTTDRYTHRENYAREILVDHLRQLRSHRTVSSHNDRPPTYDEVINKSNNTSCEDEECPPSYLEATNSPDDQQTALNLDLPEDLQTMDDPEVTIISQESD